MIQSYCIEFKHLFSPSSGVNRPEALPVCKTTLEEIGFSIIGS